MINTGKIIRYQCKSVLKNVHYVFLRVNPCSSVVHEGLLCRSTNIIATPAALISKSSSSGRPAKSSARSAARREPTSSCRVSAWVDLRKGPHRALRATAPGAAAALRHPARDASNRRPAEKKVLTLLPGRGNMSTVALAFIILLSLVDKLLCILSSL